MGTFRRGSRGLGHTTDDTQYMSRLSSYFSLGLVTGALDWVWYQVSIRWFSVSQATERTGGDAELCCLFTRRNLCLLPLSCCGATSLYCDETRVPRDSRNLSLETLSHSEGQRFGNVLLLYERLWYTAAFGAQTISHWTLPSVKALSIMNVRERKRERERERELAVELLPFIFIIKAIYCSIEPTACEI